MTWCRDAINSLFSILKTTELVDVFDILVLSYLVYWVIKLVRETRAGQLMKGIVLLFIAYIIAKFLQMKVVSYLMEQAFSIGVIALMIMFQPELRRALEKILRVYRSVIACSSGGKTDVVYTRFLGG